MKKIAFYILSFVALVFISGVIFNHVTPLAGIFLLLILGFVIINYIENQIKKQKEKK